MNTSIQGALAEEQAARYLSNKGYRILTRNFHATGGEIDIVSSYKKMLVFVEVKDHFFFHNRVYQQWILQNNHF